MLKRYAICRNCRHWRQGAPSDMRQPVVEDEDADVGACEMAPASLFEQGGEWVAFQPITHAMRSCADFDQPLRDPGHDDDPDDPDDGEPHPIPSRVRQLFPIPPTPIAA